MGYPATPARFGKISDGNVGLMQALNRLRAGKGLSLRDLRACGGSKCIQDYILARGSLVKIGTTANQKKRVSNAFGEKTQDRGLKAATCVPIMVAFRSPEP